MKLFMITILLTLSSVSYAASGTDCASIKDQKARLACFDRRFPVEPTEPSQPTAPSTGNPQTAETAPAEGIKAGPAAPVAAKPPTDSRTVVAAPASSKQTVVENPDINAPENKEKDSFTRNLIRKTKKMFDRDTVQFSAAIKQVINKDRKKMVYLLDNDQIWLQSSPRNLPIHEGDTVTIKSGFMGGYILRNDKGTSTRVERIR